MGYLDSFQKLTGTAKTATRDLSIIGTFQALQTVSATASLRCGNLSVTRTKNLGQDCSRDEALLTVEEGADVKYCGVQTTAPAAILLVLHGTFLLRAVFQAMPAQRCYAQYSWFSPSSSCL